ncbi:MAG: methyltransferase domain-containing protein [Acidimicrobiales bacterium]
MDFVPGMFDSVIVRDPEYNVAYWNLHSRLFRWTGERYEVDGRPLAFFHFSGYSPDDPHRLSKHQGFNPRILLSEHSDIARICDEYGQSLVAHGFDADRAPRFGFEVMADGSPMDSAIRYLYRRWVEESDEHGTAPPPDPFDPDEVTNLIALLNEAPNVESDLGNLTLYLGTFYWMHPELTELFPDPQLTDRPAFLQWAHEQARAGRMPRALVTVPPGTGDSSQVPPLRTTRPWAPPDSLEPGIVVAGYFNAETGVGEAGRLTAQVVEAAGLDVMTFTTTSPKSREEYPFRMRGSSKRNLDTNIVAVNADQFPTFMQEVGPEFFSGRYTIGQWAWEVDEFPPEYWPTFDLVDEVWALSEFNRKSIAAVTDKPVFTVPLPIVAPTVAPGLSKASFGLPERPMFLFCFDLLSIMRRKNPLGLIDAFQRAFAPDDGPVLVLKIISGDQRVDDLERIRWACKDRPDIVIVDDYLHRDEYGALIALADCYVSLHRSEGLGLTMGEAMALGKPVIATGYSGNLDFMNSETAYLVPWNPISVPPGCDPYPTSATWADPDLDVAAGLMQHVASRPDEAADVGRRAQQVLERDYGMDRATEFVRRRFEAIQLERSAGTEQVARLQVDLGANAEPPAVRSFSLVRGMARPIVRRIRERHDRHHENESRALTAALNAFADAQVNLEEEHQAHMISLNRSSLRAQAELDQLQQSLDLLRGMNEHLKLDLTDGSAGRISLKDIYRTVTGLRAVPYMGAAAPFLLTGPDGKKAIGYSSVTTRDAEGYAGFEDVFRGTEEVVRGLLSYYRPLLADCSSVVDVGCGRGEMLDLLAEAGIAATGVDIDESMIERCQKKGHHVCHEDAITYLAGQKDQSIGGVFSAQFIEHLPYDQLQELLRHASRVLEPGGLLVAETVNPHAAHGFKTFWVDLTHRVPIYPEVLIAHCRDAGYCRAEIVFPGGTGELEVDRWTVGRYALIARTGNEPVPV